jgi:hypothetical protein
MTDGPSPATIAARFGRRPPAIPASQAPRPAPTGWDDTINLPMEEHFYLDTGILHSLACSFKVIGLDLVTLLRDHEENSTILIEATTQDRRSTLASMSVMLLAALTQVARQPCPIRTEMDEVETIRNELVTDAQQRHPDTRQGSLARAKHGGEAELIHLARRHGPPAVLVSNDAGASAVAAKRGLASIHFLHILRGAVRIGTITVDQSLQAAKEGLSESGLEARERARTERAHWLRS